MNWTTFFEYLGLSVFSMGVAFGLIVFNAYLVLPFLRDRVFRNFWKEPVPLSVLKKQERQYRGVRCYTRFKLQKYRHAYLVIRGKALVVNPYE